MSEDKTNDFERYRAAVSEITENHESWINVTSARSYEYGILAIKNVLFVSGGALLAIPAIVGLTENFDRSFAAISGVSFATAVGLSILCIYLIHINWLSHFHKALWERQKEIKRAWGAFLPEVEWTGETDEVLEARIRRNNKIINLTFVLPHLIGLSTFFAFGYGCVRLYQSVGF